MEVVEAASLIVCGCGKSIKLVIDYIVISVEQVADPLKNCAGNLLPALRVRVWQGSKAVLYLAPHTPGGLQVVLVDLVESIWSPHELY